VSEELFVAEGRKIMVGAFTEQELQDWLDQHPNEDWGPRRLRPPPDGYPDPPATGRWVVSVRWPKWGQRVFTGPFVRKKDAEAYADRHNDLWRPVVHELTPPSKGPR
jgi:hypothetical protein